MKQEDSLLSWVKRGKNRKSVLLSIEGKMLPSEIMRKTFGKGGNTNFNLTSRALSELENKRLIKILNHKEKTGRLYTLTNIGLNIQKLITSAE